MIPIRTHQHNYRLPTRNGYIVDARIAWWKIQTRRQAVVLTVLGELDASNTDWFARSVDDVVSVGDPFIIDLSEVSFVGVQCLRTLVDLDASCRAAGTPWALVLDGAVPTLLRRLTDYDIVLPVTSSLSEALEKLSTTKGFLSPRVYRMTPRTNSTAG